MDELVYWLAIQNIKDKLDLSLIPKSIDTLGSIESLWNASESDLLKLGWSNYSINGLFTFANNTRLSQFEEILYFADTENIRVIKYTDEEYPKLLKNSKTINYQPPLILFVKGNLLRCKNCVAVVGTRNASHSALIRARQISRELAKSGYTIVSGLARGIDHEAHCGALDVPDGKTIATLAWMLPIYPEEHAELAKEIEKNGAILSELFMEPKSSATKRYSKYGRSRFVIRNRIISGLSNFIIAIESGPDGGTIRQVELALSQNKSVYVLEPEDDVSEEKKIGYKSILNMGAKSIIDLEDMTNINHYL